MYSQNSNTSMAPPQKPETFMLSSEAQQSLPHDAQIALNQVDNLKYFLISAPVDWTQDQFIRRFLLPTGEYVSCVLWNNLFHISGTDIVRCLSFRFQAFGRPVKNSKKFEEGIFSDLRNLKSGTDASLEEPKSAFLDFMYKNNCIRTQKKQKVFYWYSVPHDRLFLDALERDLKREKMGQEATTVAVNEPALSFEFDSSQSLFEQLTKAQQANTSSFSAQASSAYSQSTSPAIRAVDSMPPPQMVPQTMPTVTEELGEPLGAFSQTSMPPTNAASNYVKREQDFGQLSYDRNGLPLSRAHQRHTSMPTYMEYSPAPSFVSSQYEDYSNRGVSYEPLTPPQQAQSLVQEPAYIANEDTGLYTALPDVSASQSYNTMMQLPPSNLSGPQFSGNRGYPNNGVYSVIEGSPTYKQRRRRSSIPAQATGVSQSVTSNGQTHAPHRQSDLRRSVSLSVGPLAEGEEQEDDSPTGIPNSYINNMQQQKDLLEHLSRHGTPLPTLEGSPAPPSANHLHQQQQDDMPNYQTNGISSQQISNISPTSRSNIGPVRRARSATVMELGPYSQKSHSCPIPSCGRLFKRLEHLKRHVRTHTQEKPFICGQCSKAFSRSDNLAQHKRIHEQQNDGTGPQQTLSEEELEMEENEFGAIGEESPTEIQGQFQPQMQQQQHHEQQQSQHVQLHETSQQRQQPPAQMGGQHVYADQPQYETASSYLNAGVGLHGTPMGMHGGAMAPSLGVVGYGHQ